MMKKGYELKKNLEDALTLFLEVQKEQVEKDYSKRKIVKLSFL